MNKGNTLRIGAVRQNPNLTMGSCSSNKEIKVIDFNIDSPIDLIKAVTSFKDNVDLYLMILNRFRNFSVLPAINSIGQCIEAENMSKVKLHAQSLKASAATIGAGVLHYDCYFIQEGFSQNNPQKIRARYNRLIENSVNFLDVCEIYLEQNKDKVVQPLTINKFDIQKEIYLAKGYRLEKIGNDKFDSKLKWACVKDGQTVDKRMKERSEEEEKPFNFKNMNENTLNKEILDIQKQLEVADNGIFPILERGSSEYEDQKVSTFERGAIPEVKKNSEGAFGRKSVSETDNKMANDPHTNQESSDQSVSKKSPQDIKGSMKKFAKPKAIKNGKVKIYIDEFQNQEQKAMAKENDLFAN